MKISQAIAASLYASLVAGAPIEKRIQPNRDLAVALPLYSWPIDGAWDPTYNVISSNPGTNFSIIVNPDSGPSSFPPNADYVAGVAKLNSFSNVAVYGYFRVGFAARSLSDVQDDINNYEQWNSYQDADIHLDGLFVDEAPDDLQHLGYMQSVHSAIRSIFPSSTKIWTNPGCIVDAKFYDYADTVTAFESDFDYWMSPSRKAIPWELHSRTSVMIMSYAGQSQGPAEQAKLLVERGFQSGFLWGQESYQEHSSTWQSFAEALGGDEKNGTY